MSHAQPTIPSSEEKSSRHIARIAKFLDDKKPSEFALFQTYRSYSISFNFSCQMLAKFWGVESDRTVSKFRKGKIKFWCCVHLLHKAGA